MCAWYVPSLSNKYLEIFCLKTLGNSRDFRMESDSGRNFCGGMTFLKYLYNENMYSTVGKFPDSLREKTLQS